MRAYLTIWQCPTLANYFIFELRNRAGEEIMGKGVGHKRHGDRCQGQAFGHASKLLFGVGYRDIEDLSTDGD